MLSLHTHLLLASYLPPIIVLPLVWWLHQELTKFWWAALIVLKVEKMRRWNLIPFHTREEFQLASSRWKRYTWTAMHSLLLHVVCLLESMVGYVCFKGWSSHDHNNRVQCPFLSLLALSVCSHLLVMKGTLSKRCTMTELEGFTHHLNNTDRWSLRAICHLRFLTQNCPQHKKSRAWPNLNYWP
jgi:hypothetical protein